MVLGFGRKKKDKDDDDLFVRVSPSLPELAQQGIPWPDNLVDIKAVRKEVSEEIPHGAAKTSFQSTRGGTISFHRPFRSTPGSEEASGRPAEGSIASLYINKNPPTSFFRTSSHSGSFSYHQRSQRRPRVAPTFNLMVAGAQGTGKTSFLKLLLETCDLSPGATSEQRAAVDRFMQSGSRSTRSLQTACIEIAETRFDRVLLTVIDTPGLDFSKGQELGLERQVSSIVKYLDLQFAETLGEESKVVRQSKGDQHVHLCVYFIDPESVVPEAVRRNRAAGLKRSRSQATISYRPDDLSSVSSGESSDSSSEDEKSVPAKNDRHRLTVSPSEIRVIQRLSERVNVLPVIARADSVTDDKLNSIKKAIRRDLSAAGLGFGVFGRGRVRRDSTKRRPGAATEAPFATDDAPIGSPIEETPESAAGDEAEVEERESRPVIQIKKARPRLSRSRSRRNLQEEDEDLFVGSKQLGGGPLTGPDISNMLPFGLIAPEFPRRKRASKANGHTPASPEGNGSAKQSEELASAVTTPERRRSVAEASPGAASFNGSTLPYFSPPRQRDLKGKYVRKFRWGTVDVLEPAHCDFSALRAAILNTHMKALKSSTKEVLYEKFRTEKLFARRATRNISDDDRKRLLQDLGI